MKHKNICGNCGKSISRRELIDGKCIYCGAELYEEFERIKDKILKERGYRCEFCGATSGEAVITIHHLDFNPMNNNPENLVVLCAPCHLRFQNRFKITRNQTRIKKWLK